MAWLRRNGLKIYAGLAVAYMLVPIVVIAVFSFGRHPKGKLTFALDDGFTLEYWKDAFAIAELNDALITSLELAALSTVDRDRDRDADGDRRWSATSSAGRRASNLLIVLPMATPEIVIGAALLSMFVNYIGRSGLQRRC